MMSFLICFFIIYLMVSVISFIVSRFNFCLTIRCDKGLVSFWFRHCNPRVALIRPAYSFLCEKRYSRAIVSCFGIRGFDILLLTLKQIFNFDLAISEHNQLVIGKTSLASLCPNTIASTAWPTARITWIVNFAHCEIADEQPTCITNPTLTPTVKSITK